MNFLQYREQKIADAISEYENKIDYYEQLKNVFEQVLKDSLAEKYQELLPQGFETYINSQLLKDINYNEMMTDINEQLDIMINNIKNTNGTLWNDIEKAIKEEVARKKSKNSDKIRARDTILKAINERFTKIFESYNVMNDFVSKASLYVAQSQNPAAETAGTIHGAYHYFKRRLINSVVTDKMNQKFKESLLSDQAIKGYAYLLGGYLREVLTDRAINDLGANGIHSESTIDNNPFYDLKITGTNLSDALIGKIPKEIKAKAVYDVDRELIQPFLGIQSKSWQPPKNLVAAGKNLRQQWFEIGKRENVLKSPQFSDLKPNSKQEDEDRDRGWHNSVALCAKHMEMLIGAYTLGYALNGGFVYTSDLIKQMMKERIFLTFYFERGEGKALDGGYGFTYPATSLVVWQKSLYIQKFIMDKKRKNKI